MKLETVLSQVKFHKTGPEVFHPHEHIFVQDQEYANKAETLHKTFQNLCYEIFQVSFHVE
jgi:predicted metal-dependent phosphotriesterase family hydrolase